MRNMINLKIREIKKLHLERFIADMERDIYEAQRKVWKMLKNRRKPVNEYIEIKTILHMIKKLRGVCTGGGGDG